ncbi:competence protein ComK [Peribacillus deserti]|uniref:Transcriptional regulator n=1 Tax=Peribacillus deserti TaxID=673318 RepID=A0A2N5M024_9BACI|nr:competence protein ComK [Peribacillus deserti]PLT27712.1 transcriptional regulator [Peribacillus deserti]
MASLKSTLVEEYEINPYTLVVMPLAYGSKIYSQIIEIDGEVTSPFKPMDIIKKSCEYFGSSYEGRKDGTRQLIGITHKLPITIDPTSNIFVFPTNSPGREDCIWICHEHVDFYQRTDMGETIVTFRNKKQISIPISFSSFESQMFRTAMLRTKLIQRIEETQRKSMYLFTNSAGEASDLKANYFLMNKRR